MPTRGVRLVSKAGTGRGNNHSYNPVISADGFTVAFTSGASNLVANDLNGFRDVSAVSVQYLDATLEYSSYIGQAGPTMATFLTLQVLRRTLMATSSRR